MKSVSFELVHQSCLRWIEHIKLALYQLSKSSTSEFFSALYFSQMLKLRSGLSCIKCMKLLFLVRVAYVDPSFQVLKLAAR